MPTVPSARIGYTYISCSIICDRHAFVYLPRAVFIYHSILSACMLQILISKVLFNKRSERLTSAFCTSHSSTVTEAASCTRMCGRYAVKLGVILYPPNTLDSTWRHVNEIFHDNYEGIPPCGYFMEISLSFRRRNSRIKQRVVLLIFHTLLILSVPVQ